MLRSPKTNVNTSGLVNTVFMSFYQPENLVTLQKCDLLGKFAGLNILVISFMLLKVAIYSGVERCSPDSKNYSYHFKWS